MHAISQEPVPCIYAQLETACSASSEDDENDDMYPEIRLIPAESDKCELSAYTVAASGSGFGRQLN